MHVSSLLLPFQIPHCQIHLGVFDRFTTTQGFFYDDSRRKSVVITIIKRP